MSWLAPAKSLLLLRSNKSVLDESRRNPGSWLSRGTRSENAQSNSARYASVARKRRARFLCALQPQTSDVSC